MTEQSSTPPAEKIRRKLVEPQAVASKRFSKAKALYDSFGHDRSIDDPQHPSKRPELWADFIAASKEFEAAADTLNLTARELADFIANGGAAGQEGPVHDYGGD